MVNLQPRNKKLYERALAILEQAAHVDRKVSVKTLQAADMNMPLALVMLKTGLAKPQAGRRLKSNATRCARP